MSKNRAVEIYVPGPNSVLMIQCVTKNSNDVPAYDGIAMKLIATQHKDGDTLRVYSAFVEGYTA